MMTAPYTVSTGLAGSGDGYEVARIAKECGLGTGWRFINGATVLVARVNGRVTAFCAYRVVQQGILVDELWCEHTRLGVHGLAALGAEVEAMGNEEARRRGGYARTGGIVMDENVRHKAALIKRGYRKVGEVYSKEHHYGQ